MQIQADVLGVPVVRSQVSETTALGAAYLAGLATGFWSGADEISGQWQEERRFEPQWTALQRQERQGRWRQAVDRARNWAV
jgi:glycerol kinase